MKTLEEIKGNCIIEEGDDEREHWLWQGAMRSRRGHQQRVPAVWAPDYTKDPAGVMCAQSVARAIVHITTGKPIKKGRSPYRICNCERCVNPACYTRPLTPKEWGAFARKYKILPQRKDYTELNLRSWDTRGRKYSDDLVKDIMISDQSASEIERTRGIAEHYVHTIRRGEARRRAARVAMGVFGGLMP